MSESVSASPVRLAGVTADPIDPDAVAAAVVGDGHGALVVFHGIVRDHDGGRPVVSLGYEAHPSAETRLRTVAEEVADAVPGVRLAVVHRTGELAIGEFALVCAVAAAHRAEAFDACARLVDELKLAVPIWKHQRFADGGSEWVGIGDAPDRARRRSLEG